jgi:hypothetical protein
MAIRSCLLFIATKTIPSVQIETVQGPARLVFVICPKRAMSRT